jgi:hypothetical protein
MSLSIKSNDKMCDKDCDHNKRQKLSQILDKKKYKPNKYLNE